MTPHDCREFEPVWQGVLDRELPPECLAEAGECGRCEPLAAFARLLLEPTPTPRPEWTGPSVLAESARRDRRQGRGTLAALLAVAAILMIGVGALTPARPAARAVVAVTPPEVPLRVGDWLADARASLGEMPTFTIATPSVSPRPTTPGVPAEVAGLPAAAKSGFEPIADTTLKALDYFRRGAGLAPRAKS